MRVIGVYNLKGGVGKTSITVNLAFLAAEQGARTLIWDLDVQGATTYYFRIKPKIKGGVSKLIRKKSQLDRWIRGTDFDNLDLLPADLSFRRMELQLDRVKKPVEVFRRRLKKFHEDYDYVFLDCPPGLSLVSLSLIRASGFLLVPIIPTTLSMRSLDLLYESRVLQSKKPGRVMPLVSMMDRRRKLHREIQLELLTTHRGALRTSIPNASVVERMGQERCPLFVYAPRSRAAEAFRELWREIQERISGKESSN